MRTKESYIFKAGAFFRWWPIALTPHNSREKWCLGNTLGPVNPHHSIHSLWIEPTNSCKSHPPTAFFPLGPKALSPHYWQSVTWLKRESSFPWLISQNFAFLNTCQSLFFKGFIYLFLERGEGRERGREKHQCMVASHASLTGDLAHNPGMYPDWKSNPQPFGLKASTQSTEHTSQGNASLSMKMTTYLMSTTS